MADRPPPVTRPSAARPVRTAATSMAGAPGPVGVRRNLFQSSSSSSSITGGLARRPTPASSSSTSAETLRLDAVDVLSDSDDLVVRNRHGDFEISDPPTPPVGEPGDAEIVDEQMEAEVERKRLAEAVREHQINYNQRPASSNVWDVEAKREHIELLDVLHASMRAQVAALAEDKWMFEPEEILRLQ